MKKILLLLNLSLMMTFSLVAQQTSNIVIFAEEITPFYAIVNGIQQNSELETNVRITGLTNPANQIKIIFQDQSIPTIDKQVYFQAMDVEVTMKIKNTKKGYKLRYFGEIPLNSAPISDDIPTISYHTTYIEESIVVPAVSTTVVTEETVIVQSGVPANTNTNTTTESVNVNMNMGGVNMNVGVNVSETNTNSSGVVNQNIGVQTSSSTTTTTTTNIPQDVVIVESNVIYVEGYTGSIGCEIPSQNMNNIIATIDNESFSDDKMMIAKQATRDKCLTTSQVIRIMDMFSFEDDKLDFAKYAYDRTYDVDNYYQVTSVFTFNDAKEELNNYIMNR